MELGVPRKYGTPFFSRYKYCFQYTATVGIMEIFLGFKVMKKFIVKMLRYMNVIFTVE